RLPQLARSVCRADSPASTATLDLFEPLERLRGADQYPGSATLGAGDDVAAEVDPHGSIHVEVPGGQEHRRIAGVLPAEGMACRIVLVVGLGLDDAHPHTGGPDVAHELAAEQPPRGPFHGRLEKVEIRHDPILSRRLAAGRIRRHPEPASSGGSRMEASISSGEKAAM